MLLKISHTTVYEYSEPVPSGLQQVRLTPKTRKGQNVKNWDISIEGAQTEATFFDQHYNDVLLVFFENHQSRIKIFCEGVVETTDIGGILGEHSGFAPLWYFTCPTRLTQAGKEVKRLVKELGKSHENDIARMHTLSALILEKVSYKIGETDPNTSAERVLEQGAGVCQDHAHVLISAARHLQHPARYVSGYLMIEGREIQDASHAWAEVYFDNVGWIGFDVSNGISPDERYVRVATGLDYTEAAPVSGLRTVGPGEQMNVEIQVQQ